MTTTDPGRGTELRLRPLPRSLDPLPDESLPGFLMRLSYRLGISPAQLVAETGLRDPAGPTGWSIPSRWLVRIEQPAVERFARLVRLTGEQVESFTLRPHAGRYRPLADDQELRRYPRAAYSEPWVFARFSRYCPQCLAGDGSEIQNRLGGPWRRAWRLPIVFACLEHNRLLENRCPICRTPALGLVPRVDASGYVRGIARSTSLPRPGVVQHPARCRAEHAADCPGQLDDTQTNTAADVAGSDLRRLLQLQRRLLSLLNADNWGTARSLGQRVDAAAYLHDLRITAAFLQGTWPDAAAGTDSPGLAHIYDRYRNSGDFDDDLHQRPKWASVDTHLWDTPPAEPAACGALLALAADILARPSAKSVQPQISRMRTGIDDLDEWLQKQIHPDSHVTPRLRRGLDAAPWKFGVPGHPDPQVNHRYVPQLPSEPSPILGFDQAQDTHRRHILRIMVAIRLIQLSRAVDVLTAASQLGVPAADARRWTKTAANESAVSWDTFQAAVDATAKHLAALSSPIDYQKRRDYMARWELGPDDMRNLFSDDIDRRINADLLGAYMHTRIWCLVTGGLHLLAPKAARGVEANTHRPPGKHSVYDYGALTWRRRKPDKFTPYWSALEQRIDDFATALAASIDRL